MIEFTQYLRPDGRKRPIHIADRPAEIEEAAQRFVAAGGKFEAEELTTGQVSLTAVFKVGGVEGDVEIEVVPNGPGIAEAVDRLVKRAAAYAA